MTYIPVRPSQQPDSTQALGVRGGLDRLALYHHKAHSQEVKIIKRVIPMWADEGC